MAFIRDKYSSVADKQHIFLVCYPSASEPLCSYVQNVVNTERAQGFSNVHYIDLGDILVYPDDYGCDLHPNVCVN